MLRFREYLGEIEAGSQQHRLDMHTHCGASVRASIFIFLVGRG